MIDRQRPNAAAKAAVIGIVLALIAQLLAFFPAGAGHGYGAPFFASIPLLLVYPVTLVRGRADDRGQIATGRTGKTLAWDIGIVIFAVAANYFLIREAIDFRANVGSIHDEYLVPGVSRSVFPMFVAWLGLWLFWQWLAFRNLVRHVLRPAPSASHR